MKIFIADECKTKNLFIYGGFIIDSTEFYIFKNELMNEFEKVISKKIPPNIEIKRGLEELNKQLIKHIQYLEESESSQLLSYDFTDSKSSLSSTRSKYFTMEDLCLMKEKTFCITKKYENLKFIAFIFPDINLIKNERDKLERYIKGITYCADTFEKYLLENETRGIMIMDRISDTGKQEFINKEISDWSLRRNFKRIDLFLPQIIMGEPFSVPNLFLGLIGEYFQNNTDEGFKKIKKDLENMKNNIYRIDIYPKVFYNENREKLEFLKLI
jgi:hypothetical protein